MPLCFISSSFGENQICPNNAFWFYAGNTAAVLIHCFNTRVVLVHCFITCDVVSMMFVSDVCCRCCQFARVDVKS